MLSTLETSHPSIGWSNAAAKQNMPSTFCTLETFHPPIGWLSALAASNMPHMLSTLENIPSPNRLVECPSFIEHVLDVSHIGRVPCTKIFIEGTLRLKQLFHTCHAGHVPMADMSMRLPCRITIRAPEVHCLMDISIRSAQPLIEQQRAKHLADEIGIERNDSDASIVIPESIQSRNDHVEFPRFEITTSQFSKNLLGSWESQLPKAFSLGISTCVELFCCRWLHDLLLPSITHSNLLKF